MGFGRQEALAEITTKRALAISVNRLRKADLERLIKQYETRDHAATETLCRQLLAQHPDSFAASRILGSVLHEQGKLTEAIQTYRRVIQLEPDYVQAYVDLSSALIEARLPAQAIAVCKQVLTRQPNSIQAHDDWCVALQQMGLHRDALGVAEAAVAIDASSAQAHHSKASALSHLGRHTQAIAYFNRAIELDPNDASAYNGRGYALLSSNRRFAALADLKRAALLGYNRAVTLNNIGLVYEELGQLDEAEAYLRQAIDNTPALNQASSNLLLTLNYNPHRSIDTCLAEARAFNQRVTQRIDQALFTRAYAGLAGPSISARSAERLRIGFVSGDLRNHPVGYFLESILSAMSLEQFDLAAFPTTPTRDELTQRIQPNFSIWQPIAHLNDYDAARLIRQHSVDILIDLSGHTAYNRLAMFVLKPAPIQISWLGYFATTGLQAMDYLLGDPHVTPPEHDHHFVEKVWRLPDLRWCFTAPAIDLDVAPLPALNKGQVTFGSFNNLSKLNTEVLDLWSSVLRDVPTARMLIKAKQLNDAAFVDDLVKRFHSRGITSDRLDFQGQSSRTSYLETYHQVDAILDTFPFTGGTVTAEALWMGVPTITLAGDRLVARQGQSIMEACGLSDWVANDISEYVTKAVTLTQDLQQLAALRRRLRSQLNTSPLFDAPRFARHLQDALIEIWRRQ